MTNTRTGAFEVHALPADRLAAMRAAGYDEFDNPLDKSVHAAGAAPVPLRCCLTESAVGDVIALIAWRPFTMPGPYAESGPVFIHVKECEGYLQPAEYPEAFRHRPQIFRSYGRDGRIVDAEVVEGSEAETALARLLDRSDVAFVHSRNITYGCYMFEVRQA